MKSPLEKVYLMERDIKMLLFIWKWKLVSASALHLKFFPNCVSRVAYNRLWKLTKSGYLQQIPLLGGRFCAWSLDRKGFEMIKSRLPLLQSEGFKSERPEHDLITSAIHLGEFLLDIPLGCEYVSEQELRNYHIDSLPLWVPLPTQHRSDGYLRIETQTTNKVISLEVELNQKSRERYELICDFYSKEMGVNSILWLVNNEATGAIIQKQIRELFSKDLSRHNFIYLKDFLENKYNAKVTNGTGSQMYLSLFVDESANKTCSNYMTSSLLDFRKCPTNQSSKQSENQGVIFT